MLWSMLISLHFSVLPSNITSELSILCTLSQSHTCLSVWLSILLAAYIQVIHRHVGKYYELAELPLILTPLLHYSTAHSNISSSCEI